MTYSNVLSGFRCISTKTQPENPRTRFARHTKRSTLYRRASKSTRIFKTLAIIKLMTYFCSLSFVFRTGEAWPTEMRGCDMDAHPSTARARHGIPKKSTNTKIYVSWANHNASHVPNTNENQPQQKNGSWFTTCLARVLQRLSHGNFNRARSERLSVLDYFF